MTSAPKKREKEAFGSPFFLQKNDKIILHFRKMFIFAPNIRLQKTQLTNLIIN